MHAAPRRNQIDHGGPMKIAKVLRVKTEAATHIVIRDGAGKKLCDIDVFGMSITVTVPPKAKIEVEPRPTKSQGTRSASQRLAALLRRRQ
jgi:hypothetical protein